MAHARNTIRDAVVAAITGLATTGNNVSANRVNPYLSLPSLNVLTNQEDVREDMGSMDDIQIRELRLMVECRDSGTSPDDKLDVVADEVITAMLNDPTVIGLVFDITVENTSFTYSRDGSKHNALAEIEFNILYQTYDYDPSIIIS